MQALQKITVTIAIMVFVAILIPSSPFTNALQEMQLGIPLAWLNWFFPIGKIFATLTVWTLAISAYYLYAWVMRQLDVIQ